jgi:sterol desaturase/sphingolipid hydroxylase (fatty acid hydroxylase superfamily)
MSAIESWVVEAAPSSAGQMVMKFIYGVLTPPWMTYRERADSLGLFAVSNVERLAQTFVWYTLAGLVVYTLSVLWLDRKGSQRFSYPHPVEEPGSRFSLGAGVRYVLPRSFYTHPSFRIDMMWLPFSIVLSFLGLLGATLGAGVVGDWLTQRVGSSPLHIPEGSFAIALQTLIIIVARDFGRFMWHYQGHSLPFFWEFHKGHHSAEVLHPFGVRTHPVDMFIRNTYTGAGGGLIAGTLFWILGTKFSMQAASYVTAWLTILALLERFEHSHVRIGFGKWLDRFFYAPYMHHFHHGALPQHMNVNLGITGGLLLWDKLFGTLYWPQPGEKIVWGASPEELGENNPHRTLWGFFFGPFIAAFRTLRRAPSSPIAPSAASLGNNA